MPIRLTKFERVKPHETADNENPVVNPENSFVYKDIDLDLEFGSVYGNYPVNKPSNTSDLKDLRDVADVKQALENLFNTSPGQRLTNPFFGLNLQTFLFDPVTQIAADQISRTILQGVASSEPRVTITNIDVAGYPDEGTYVITLGIRFVDSRVGNISLTGNLTSDGFKFSSVL